MTHEIPSRQDVAATAPDAPPVAQSHQQTVVPFRTAVRAWFAISLQTFGGPAGQIAVMQRDARRRASGGSAQRRFLHALNYCMLLPGPEAQQLAIYVGWLLQRHPRRPGRRRPCSSCPGVVALLGLSAIYVALRRPPRW